MTIRDLLDNAPGMQFEADICIIGAGPAGISIALQFAQTRTKVIVVESGGLSVDPETEELNEIESVGLRRAPQNVTRCRGLGGTSALWSGRCGVFDPFDFQKRPWVPDSGWPICYDDVAPFVDRAGRMLGLGPSLYGRADMGALPINRGDAPWSAGQLLPVIFQASLHDAGQREAERSFVTDGIEGAEFIGALQHAGVPTPMRFGETYRSALQSSANIDVLLNASATEIETNERGDAAQSVRVATLASRSHTVTAKRIVLACGGIDNARILLSSRARDPRGVGNSLDMVGRYLMDHPYAPIAFYDGVGSAALRRRLGPVWFDRHGVRRVFSQGLRLHPDLQRRHGLLNCAVHMLEFGETPAAISRLGKAVRLARQRRLNGEFAREIMGALSDPPRLLGGIVDRYARNRPSLQKPDRVEFGCVVEQLPNPDSRVQLSDQLDALGMPRAKIDWRAADLEYSTACFMAEVLQREFARLGYQAPRPAEWLREGPDAYRALIHDMAHPIGSTRMSSDPAKGVVDQNCAVHGVSNLYVAGSSTFSTSGYINPTLTIVSFALRLADHLKETLSQRVVADLDRPSGIPVRRRTKIGIVGAGKRIRKIYCPIFDALESDYEITGVCSRSQESAERIAGRFGAKSYANPEEMVSASPPDFLLVAVSDREVEATLDRLTNMNAPILVETPFSWNLRKGRKLVNRISERQLLVGVAEQTPFLPVEQLKQRLIDLGLIGRVVSADNEFAVYAYHGLAGLKAYMDSGRIARRVSAVQVDFDNLWRSATSFEVIAAQAWVSQSTIVYDDGVTLHQSQCDKSLTLPGMLKVFGASGSIVDNTLRTTDQGGCTATSEIKRYLDSTGTLEALVIETPLGEVRWNNPFVGKTFDDEQIAVAHLLSRMTNAAQFGGWPAYDSERAQDDMELLTAIRYSEARRGRTVSLPLQPYVDAVKNRIAARIGQ